MFKYEKLAIIGTILWIIFVLISRILFKINNPYIFYPGILLTAIIIAKVMDIADKKIKIKK